MEKRRLTPDEWDKARRRWEGEAREGFDWLAQEMRAAFQVDISRQAVAKMVTKRGWVKQGPQSEPLAVVAQPGDVVAVDGCATTATTATETATEVVDDRGHIVKPVTGAQRSAAQVAPQPRPEVVHVDLPKGEKPPGYAGTGRPSGYRPEYDRMIIDYFDQQPTRDVEVQGFGGATKVQVLPNNPPMLAQFAHSIGVSMDTVNRWATDTDADGRPRYPSFADSYARARKLHEAMLVQGAALGVYEGRVIQFVLKNWYGWKDKADDEVVADPISRSELEATFGVKMAAAMARQDAVLAERAELLKLKYEQGT